MSKINYVDTTYPELVDNWDDMRGIELRGVVDLLSEEEGDDTHIVVDDDNPDWYSVYVRHEDGCALCISDHSRREDATRFLRKMKVEHPSLVVLHS